MNSKTKKLAQTALLLTICLLSQYFKNLSVYITGPVINACLILCVLTAGLAWASILCVVTPITAFFIAGSPIMAGIPLMFPAIMAGNFILVFFTVYAASCLVTCGKLFSTARENSSASTSMVSFAMFFSSFSTCKLI